MMFGAPDALKSPSWAAPPSAPNFSPQDAVATPERPPAAPAPRTQTGPISLGGPVPFPGAEDIGEINDEPLARQLAGRNRRAGTVVALVVLAAACGAALLWYRGRPKPPPAQLVSQSADAYRGLEVDSVDSLAATRAALAKLDAVSPPDYVTPAADELVAMAFQEADLRAHAADLQEAFAALQKQHTHADADHSRADWRSVVNSLVDRMKKVKAELDPIEAELSQLDAAQNRVFQKLSAARTRLRPIPADLDRAIGVYYAFKGAPENAQRFAKSYRALVPDDGWADLILAAAADQPRQTPATLKAGLSAAEAALKTNHRLTRAKRIQAHLELALHDVDAARATANELALEMPGDARVKRLLARIDASAAPTP